MGSYVDITTALKRANALNASPCGARHHWAWKKDHPSVNYDKQCSDARVQSSVLCAHDNGKPNLLKALATAEHHGLITTDQKNLIQKLMNQKFQDLAFVDLLPMGVFYELVGSNTHFDEKTMEAYAQHGLDKQPKDLTYKDIERITIKQQRIRGKLFIELKQMLIDVFSAGKNGDKQAAKQYAADFITRWTKPQVTLNKELDYTAEEKETVDLRSAV